MKKFFKTGTVLLAVVLASGFLGCPSGPEGDDTPYLTGIEVQVTKTTYEVGESLDKSTITVTGTYSDGSKKTITSYNVTGYDSAESGIKTVTVTAGGVSKSFTVTVINGEEARLREAIAAAKDAIGSLAVSVNGSDVPMGVKWVTAAEKKALEDAIAAAETALENGTGGLGDIRNTLETAKDTLTTTANGEDRKGTLATWSYTVTFYNNDDTETSTAKTVENPATTVGSLPTPTRDRFILSGWNTQADGKGSPFTAATPVYKDIAVYAVWTFDQTQPLTEVEFKNLSANGSSETAKTTKLTLIFDKDITGLAVGDITLTPSGSATTGIRKGTLTRTGTGVYDLLVTGITGNGGVTVEVNKAGYTVQPSRYVDVYCPTGQAAYGGGSSFPSYNEPSDESIGITVAIEAPDDDTYPLLEPEEWRDGEITGSGDDYYQFYAISGRTYSVYWDDTDAQRGKTCDVVISANWSGNNASIFTRVDSGYYPGQQFTANRTGFVVLQVSPRSSGSTGTYAIRYTVSGGSSSGSASLKLPLSLPQSYTTFTVTAEYESYAWYIDGAKQPEETGSFVLDTTVLDAGIHHLTVQVSKDGIPYSRGFDFTVTP